MASYEVNRLYLLLKKRGYEFEREAKGEGTCEGLERGKEGWK